METPVIDVRAQHRIPLGKAFALCLKGIAHRFLRSMLTLMVIVLAVAFFMSLLCESFFAHSVGLGIDAENIEERSSQRFFADWFDVVTPGDMAKRLVVAVNLPGRPAEIAAVTKATPAEVAELITGATDEARVMRFFTNLDAGSRAALVGNTKNEDIYGLLKPEDAWNEFSGKLRHLYALQPPMPMTQFRAVILGHDGLSARIATLAGAWQKAVVALGEAVADADLGHGRDDYQALFVRGDSAQLSQFHTLITARGFSESPEDIALVHRQLAVSARQQEVRERLQSDAAHAAWHTQFLEDPAIDVKMVSLDDAKVVDVLDNHWSQTELAQVSRLITEGDRRRAVERAVDDRVSQDDGEKSLLSSRQAFLLVISFVVCMVGISNAMLMAITERFREIATMKCLGATDGFILNQFLIEAAIQGLAGGVAGMLIGFVLSLAKCTVIFGVYLYAYFPLLGVVGAGCICVVAGVLLSTLASIYPSWMASRMAPMEAMRIE